MLILFPPHCVQYKAANFSSPPAPYAFGDIVVFHCLTQHEANPHGVKDAEEVCMPEEGGDDPYRVSMDGRFLMELWR
jgi:hypothetical protein